MDINIFVFETIDPDERMGIADVIGAFSGGLITFFKKAESTYFVQNKLD